MQGAELAVAGAERARGMKVGRNDPCPCGSGRKYKKCCLARNEAGGGSAQDVAGEALDVRQAALAPADAAPVAGGFHITPYTVAKIAEDPRFDADPQVRRAREKARARGEFWTIAGVSAMTTEAIEQQLLAYGVRHSRDRFLELSAGRHSAWSVSEVWLRSDPVHCVGKQVDFLGLAACELWKRWIPDRPSVEMLDDWMQEGYALVERHETAAACDLWWRVWCTLLPRFTPEMRQMEQVEPVFYGMQSVSNWSQDFEMELQNAALADPAYASIGRRYCSEWIAQFSAEDDLLQRNFRRALGIFLLHLGQGDEALAVLEGILERWPDDVWGYIAIAEAYAGICPPRQTALPPDLDRAAKYLEQAKAVATGREDREAVQDRLAELRKLATGAGRRGG